jgi:translation machinery-associated protein 16
MFSVDVLGFFYSTLPPEGELSLDELHLIVRDIWLRRYDKELEQERAKRRKGRPKSAKETQIEELKIQEAEEYRTGFGRSLWNITRSLGGF